MNHPPMRARTLVGLLPASADAFGDRTAIHFPGSPGLTAVGYRELERRTAVLRDRLARDMEPGAFVVVSGQNSIEWIIALFGAIRAGAIPVPLDPEIADDQLTPVLEEIEAAAVLADRDLLPRFEQEGGVHLALEDLAAATEEGPEAGEGARGQDCARAPEDVAVQVYTAGTTGLPKGVQLTHRNLVTNVEGVIEAARIAKGDSVMNVLPLYHAFPLTAGCLAPLAAGVPIELESRPLRMARRLREDRPTIVIGVPALYETVVRQVHRRAEHGWRGVLFRVSLALNRLLISRLGVNAGPLLFRPVRNALGGRLRYAVSGASALPRDVLGDALALGLPLMQGYGLSEAGPVISVQRFDRRRFLFSRYYWTHMGSAGEPLPGVSVTIEPVEGVEDEAVGELTVSGANVMSGYYRREEETREALRNGKLYTGDLARIDEDGEIWIVGRAKLAVSTPEGKLVHLERIESALVEAPEVAQAAVIEEETPRWRLVAVVYPAAEAIDGVSSEATVRQHVEAATEQAVQRLRPFERPAEVRLTDRPLPTTRIGKVRRGRVPVTPSFDFQRWREQAGAPAGVTEEEQEAIEQRTGRERYRFPLGFALRFIVAFLFGLQRDLGADTRLLFAGRRTRVVDAERIPRDRPFILVMNHYEREGLRVWWPAALASQAVAGVRHEVPPVRWLISDRFFGARLAGIPIPHGVVALGFRRLARVYGLITVARAGSMTSVRSGAVREAQQSLRRDGGRPVGITPEAAAGFGPVLVEPPSNAGMSVALLSGGQVPVLPVGVYEEAGELVARFGEPYTLDWPGRDEARRRRAEFTERVMRSLAELLPPELRGPYG